MKSEYWTPNQIALVTKEPNAVFTTKSIILQINIDVDNRFEEVSTSVQS